MSDIDWFLLGLGVGHCRHWGCGNLQHDPSFAPRGSVQETDLLGHHLSFILALVASRLDYHMVLEHTPWLYGISVLLLAGLLVAGHSIAGTRRWLQFGPISFQVSEIVKLIIILVVAAYFANRRSKAVTWGDLVKLGVVCRNTGSPGGLGARFGHCIDIYSDRRSRRSICRNSLATHRRFCA